MGLSPEKDKDNLGKNRWSVDENEQPMSWVSKKKKSAS